MPVILPQGYKPHLTVRQTQIAIKKVKDFFQNDLANKCRINELQKVYQDAYERYASGN